MTFSYSFMFQLHNLIPISGKLGHIQSVMDFGFLIPGNNIHSLFTAKR